MIDERGILKCDCCGRQILKRAINDKACIGPRSKGVHLVASNTHVCFACWPDYVEWEEMGK